MAKDLSAAATPPASAAPACCCSTGRALAALSRPRPPPRPQRPSGRYPRSLTPILPQPPSSAGPQGHSPTLLLRCCWPLLAAAASVPDTRGSGLAAVAAPNLHPYLCLSHAGLSGRRLGVVCRAFCAGVVCVRGDDAARTRQLCLWPLNSESAVCSGTS